MADRDEFDQELATIGGEFRSLDIEVVVANTLETWWAISAAHRVGIASIWCQHESEPWQTYFDKLIPRQRGEAYGSFAKAYRVTYVADATRKAWGEVETRHNFEIIRHGIPKPKIAALLAQWPRKVARDELGVAPDEFVVILVGTLCQRKNQQDLVEALGKLPDGILGRLKIFIVGAKPEPDYFEMLDRVANKAMGANRDRLIFTGAIESTAVYVYFAAADIAVCTSRIESAPRVIVEAMVFGLPIITTPVFGIPELVRENTNALFYEPGNSEELCEALVRLIEDSDLRQRFAKNSRSVLDAQPGFDEMLDRYAALIREAALTV